MTVARARALAFSRSLVTPVLAISQGESGASIEGFVAIPSALR